jgi:hypothetical protein
VWDGGRTVIGEPHHFRFRAAAPELFPELAGRTIGQQLNSKPTIEMLTADLPIRTAGECRVEHIAFLDRRPGIRATLTPIGKTETLERWERDMPLLDADQETRRSGQIQSMAEAPAFDLRYSNYEDAALLLEQFVGGSAA